MRNSAVILIDMPWSLLEAPSIQLGTLKSVLQRANISSEVRALNLAFMHYVRVADAPFPGEALLSPHDYNDVAEGYYHVGLGDWIFAVPLSANRANKRMTATLIIFSRKVESKKRSLRPCG